MRKELLAQTERRQPEKAARLRIIALVVLFAGAVAYLVSKKAQQGTATQNEVAPAFRLQRYGGGTVSLADLRGKVVMLNFWATWCAPCVAEMPTLTKLAQEYEAKGLVFVAANLDEPETALAQVDRYIAGTAPNLARSIVFADDQMAMSYEIQDLPTIYFIGRDGRILESYAGYSPESLLRQKIESALRK